MHSTKSSRRLTGNLKALSVAVASALILISSGADAAGLGKLTVLSSLGQPLRAEIEMNSVSKDELGTLTAKLASQAAFRQANIDFNPALLSLRFALEQRGSEAVIRVTSTQPMNEPFIDMLLELSGGGSRLVREYTFLLDPADLRMAQPVQVAAPVAVQTPDVAASAPAPSAVAPAARRTAAESNARSVPAQSTAGQVRSYEVKRGDSLAAIAHRFKPAGVSLDQMLVVLYQTNPDAFVGKNMNRLRSGQVLSVPDAAAADHVAPAEARSIVVAQTRDFHEYRNRLAGRVAAGVAKPSAESRQSAAGKITSTVQEPAGTVDEAKDKLKLSKAGGGSASGPAAASAEDLIAKDKALADANARVQELEKNLADLQKLLEIKSKSLAGQQQTDGVNTAAAPTVAAAVGATATVAEPPAEPPATADQDGAPAPAAAASAAVASAEKPATPPVKRPPAPAPVVEEPSFIDSVLDNALLLPGAGLLLVALGAFGIYSSRRKKKQKSFSDSILADSSLKANSLFGSTGGQSVDTNNSVFNSSFSPSASHLDTNEVDPVAEADVYIAYGRDAQAEEILKEALRTQPERNPVRLKLLEIYANRKDLRAFELLASELYGLTKGEGDEWSQAATLGLTIDPANPLYAGGKLGDDALAKAAIVMAPTEPLEELDLDALLATTQPHSVMREPDPPEAAATDADHFSDAPMMMPAASQGASLAEQPAVADLDFELGNFGQEVEPAPVASAPAAAADAPGMDFGTIDFTLDMAPAAPDQAAADLPEPALLAEAAPIPIEQEPQEQPHISAPAALEMASAEMQAAPAAMASATFDLDGIDLDLDAPADDDGGVDPYSAEMSTKLDLALAYREIGDREGARELLDEVVKGGSQQQIDKARSLLAELA